MIADESLVSHDKLWFAYWDPPYFEIWGLDGHPWSEVNVTVDKLAAVHDDVTCLCVVSSAAG